MDKLCRYILDWIELPLDIAFVLRCKYKDLYICLLELNNCRCEWRTKTFTFKLVKWIIAQRIKMNKRIF